MSKSKQATLTDFLRKTMEASGLSLYQIAKDTGIASQSLLRFKRGETSLRLDKADVLADYLGLELTKRKAK
jgi:transcriptional regulator with XRE-family HTH domain